METICFLPVFAVFLIIAYISRNQNDEEIPPDASENDPLTMEDIILLDMLDDDDGW